MQHHLDSLNWPVLGLNVTVLGYNWHDLWNAMPGPTALYAFLSAVFMLFQMAERMGYVERWKHRREVKEAKAKLADVESKARELQNKNLADVAHDAVGKVDQVLQHPDLSLVVKKPKGTEQMS